MTPALLLPSLMPVSSPTHCLRHRADIQLLTRCFVIDFNSRLGYNLSTGLQSVRSPRILEKANFSTLAFQSRITIYRALRAGQLLTFVSPPLDHNLENH